MSIITIHCHLHTTEPTRRLLWQVMAESNTPLISALLRHVAEHPDFDTWQTNGSVPIKTIRTIGEPIKPHYPPQPGRFYASAYQMVSYTYESWLALQKKTKLRLDGKRRWLSIVKSDAELLELTDLSLESLRRSAREVLSQLTAQSTTDSPPDTQTKKPKAKSRKPKKKKSAAQDKDLIGKLFKAYEATDDLTQRCILAYLIKNGGTLTDEPETPAAFAHRIHSKQKEIAHLEDRLQARLPKGRDLTGDIFTDTLLIAQQQEPEDVAQMRDWQAKLLMRPADLPYPIRFDSSTDMMWKPDDQGRITVNFNGLEKFLKNSDPEVKAWLKEHEEHPFRIQCAQRQLPYVQRFLTDWQAYTADTDNYPAGLLTLSSAMLAWRKGKKKRKGEPWNTYQLALYCSFDTRLLTAEGTREVQQEKLKTAQKQAKSTPGKKLNENQLQAQTSNATTLRKLVNLPDRPSRKPYQGKSELLLGISIGLSEPITVAIVDASTQQALTYRTSRTLLGDQHRLLRRQRQQQQQNRPKRQQNQKKGIRHQPSESELGQYVDRLLAKAIIQLAQTYQVSSIVLPQLTNRRDILNSEIQARAEQKCPGAIAAQAKYAKEVRISIHSWDYRRLVDTIRSSASKRGILLEEALLTDRSNHKEQAREIAIVAYQSRSENVN